MLHFIRQRGIPRFHLCFIGEETASNMQREQVLGLQAPKNGRSLSDASDHFFR